MPAMTYSLLVSGSSPRRQFLPLAAQTFSPDAESIVMADWLLITDESTISSQGSFNTPLSKPSLVMTSVGLMIWKG